MTNLQDYADSISTSPHIGDSGILGLGEGLSLLATFLLFWFIAYIIGGIREYKAEKKWLKPDVLYFANAAKAFGVLVRAMSGRTVPHAFKDSSDGNYATLTAEEVEDCMQWAYRQMLELGITYRGLYLWRAFDCEDFALFLKAFATLRYRLSHVQLKAGAPFALFGYIKDDKKKSPHVCVEAVADGKRVFYEVYPDFHGKLKISRKAIDAASLELF